MTPIEMPTIDGTPVVYLGSVLPSQGEISKENVSGKVALQFQQNDTLMWYANVATGYKGPTIDPVLDRSNKIQPEKSTAYELGAKTQFFDRSLTINVSLYKADYKDFQAQVYVPETMSFAMSNAGEMRTKGAELEVSWRPTADFTLIATGAITDAEFHDYFTNCEDNRDAPCRVIDGVLQADLQGFTPPYVSKYSYSLNGNYYHALGNGLAVTANAGWSYRSNFYNAVAQSSTKTQGYGVANLSIGIGAEDGQWEVSLYARNLLDKHYRSFMDYSPTFNRGGLMQYLSPDSFRTAGVSLTWNF